MDLLGRERARLDLMVLERARHQITATTGTLTCSCGWRGRHVTGRSDTDVQRMFARHLRRARRQRCRRRP